MQNPVVALMDFINTSVLSLHKIYNMNMNNMNVYPSYTFNYVVFLTLDQIKSVFQCQIMMRMS